MERAVAVVPLVYDLVLRYSRKVPTYPKRFTYTLGERTTNTLLDVLERLLSRILRDVHTPAQQVCNRFQAFVPCP